MAALGIPHSQFVAASIDVARVRELKAQRLSVSTGRAITGCWKPANDGRDCPGTAPAIGGVLAQERADLAGVEFPGGVVRRALRSSAPVQNQPRRAGTLRCNPGPAQADFAEAIGWSQMGAQITKTDFTCQLVTIRSKKSFAEVTGEIERLFQRYDIDEFRDLTTAGDAEKFAAYVKQVGEPTEFGIFFQMDQGSTMRLAGIPIESRFYLLGNATIAQGLFRYSASAGLGAPVRFCVSQRDGEETRIDIDQPTSFFSQFPELRTSSVPAELSDRMVPLLERVAS